MDLNEKTLPNDFAKVEITLAEKYIVSSTSFTVVGMPGVGISSFIRFLATQNFGYSIHIDLYEIHTLSTLAFFQLLGTKLGLKMKKTEDEAQLLADCRKRLSKICSENKRVILLFNRFDQLKNQFTKEFFNNIRSLWDINKQKIVFVFSANSPLLSQAKHAVDPGNISFFGTSLFLKPFSQKDLYSLYQLNSPESLKDSYKMDRAYLLSGGHYQLCELIIKSNSFDNPLSNEFILIQLKAIYEKLDKETKGVLESIAQGKKAKHSKTLLDLGIVNTDIGSAFFSPLFGKYLEQTFSRPPSPKETKLIHLFQKRLGEVVSKEEIFDCLWKDDEEHATDWALNALIYRIRKNPEFVSKGLTLKSVKKIGYKLID